MKRAAVLGAVTGMVLALSACSGEVYARNPGMWSEADVELRDGRTIHCLIFGTNHGGPSCDWANAK
ncbi:hypothetical protein [Nonomuraea typhae]|uniref:Lipoprotein n=1 Tax=Nonomuraea typhae TaxID=2603600 RepID=A0ABW7YN64_9ACTN